MPFHQLRKSGLQALVLAGLALTGAQATAADLIQNGGFEADGFTYSPSAWTVSEAGTLGAIAAADGISSHVTGYANVGAASGSYFGSIDAFSIGAWSLAQTFSTGAVSQANLSFKMFVNDQSVEGVAHVGATLNHEVVEPMYYARVDLLKAGADAFATGSDVVKSLYIGGATGRKFDPDANKYIDYSFDLGGTLAAGGNFTLRFAVANNMPEQMQLGVDNVSLQVTAVPEPESYAMLLAGLGLLGGVIRRRKNNA